jgi:hypothetical protein
MISSMVEKKSLLAREERMLSLARSKNRRLDEDPRKERYQKLAQRTAAKYLDIARKRGVAIEPAKKS